MNATVEAALISGGWATVVAALGYYYNRATARATIKATNANALAALDASHDAQLWEKKAEAYVEALAVIARRQATRLRLISPLKYDDATEKKLLESFAAPPDWDWAAASARLTAYAAQPILDATHAANQADNAVTAAIGMWEALTKMGNAAVPHGPTSDQIMDAYQKIRSAAEDASAADQRLEALIRIDLELKPSARATLAPVLNRHAAAGDTQRADAGRGES